MPEIVIPPITNAEVEDRSSEVYIALHTGQVAFALDSWTRSVIAASMMAPIPQDARHEVDNAALFSIHDNLEIFMKNQSERIADSEGSGSSWGIGSIALFHTLEATRDEVLAGRKDIEWPVSERFVPELALRTAKTILHLERFDELIKQQPIGTPLTSYRYMPSNAESVVLGEQEGVWSVFGSDAVVVPSYAQIYATSAGLQGNGKSKSELLDAMTLGVDGIIDAIANNRIYPVDELNGHTPPIETNQLFLGTMPEGTSWHETEELHQRWSVSFYRNRFTLVKAASEGALRTYQDWVGSES